nr:hypothetical protein [uncultured Roseateles sp.]
MMKNADRSLKSSNFKWHIALATADAILLGLFVAPEVLTSATATQLGLFRALSAALMPVLVLLLLNLLSSNAKAMLVFWKPLGVLPGCEAFTRHGPADPRVDMAQLKKNVGALPTDPKEQNSKWYKLYKQIESRTEVMSAQKDFLMYRDMAVLSLPLALLTPVALWGAGVGASGIWGAAGLFVAQYLLTRVSARHAAERFVCTVLAVHSAVKIPKAAV